MALYDSNGFINMPDIISEDYPFIFIIGGRGTGKTYGALKYVLENKIKVMFMRRTQAQIDSVSIPDLSPFKSLNEDLGMNIQFDPISKYNKGIYHATIDDNGKVCCSGAPIGYSCALSTISNIRGFDASDVQLLTYDEFVPEKQERPIKLEGQAFLNAVETISRNRELKGKKPLKVLCLSNSNDLANPLFMELGLVGIAEKMKRKEIIKYCDKDRGLALYVFPETPIGKKKRDTALYRLTQDSTFSKMALDNDFAYDVPDRIESHKLTEYRPIVSIGEITIYRHKNDMEFYVSEHCMGSPVKFSTSEIDRKRFISKYQYLWLAFLGSNIAFENQLCQILFTRYFT